MKNKSLTVLIVISFLLFPTLINQNNIVDSAEENKLNNNSKIYFLEGKNEFYTDNRGGKAELAFIVMNKDETERTIDSCYVDYLEKPFRFKVSLKDNIGTDFTGKKTEPIDGYLYFSKTFMKNIFPEEQLKGLAVKSKNYEFKKIGMTEYFRVSVDDFSKSIIEWGQYNDKNLNERWFTWGNKNNVLFKERAMFIKKIQEDYEHLKFDISSDSDNSGQKIAFSKSYLQNKGIINPVFELKNKYSYERVSYKTNSTHYLVDFPHFSEIGIHEASTGRVTGYIINDTYDTSNTITGYYDDYYTGNTWNNNPGNMVDGHRWNDASPDTSGNWEQQQLISHNISSYSNNKNITKVELRYYMDLNAGSFFQSAKARIAPYFENTTIGSYYLSYSASFSDISGWSSWGDITNDDNAPSSWSWDNVSNLSVMVDGEENSETYVGISKVELRVTYETESFYLNRTTGLVAESVQNCDSSEIPSFYNPSTSWTDNPILVFPVSNQTNAINNVTNNTCGTQATEATSLDDVVNNTFWFDSVDKFVYIGTIDLTPSTKINWTVNGTSGSTFSINIPPYLDMGELCFIHGKIKDADGNDLNDIEATTHVYQSGVDMITPVEWNCTGGNVQASFYTTTLEPGIYEISMEFTKDGLTFKYGETIYIAIDPPSGNYISANLHFSYYNSATGLGLDSNKFKLFVSTDTSIDSSDRIYRDYYEDTYTGQTLYYRVDDYFDNQIYPTTGDYETLTVTSTNQWENIPIDWYSFSVKNMNHSIVYFQMTNESRTYNQYLFPYEPFYFNVLNGTYTINLTYYDSLYSTPDSSHILSYSETTIDIDDDSYYWIQGYDLQDIIISVTAVNTSIDSLSIDITTGVNLTDSAINNINVAMTTNLSVVESNITALNNQIWNSINISDSVVDYINNTIWNEISSVNLTIDYINNTLWTDLTFINSSINSLNSTVISNFTFVNTTVDRIQHHVTTMWNTQNSSFTNLENRSTVVFSFYNTNEGLGLDRETLKVYINGTRLIGDTYYCYNESDTINITIKDYYNNTLYHNNFTITSPYTFIDLGLTFHSWLFSDKNDDYYMISIKKYGASRWWERGIVPYGEREFLIPSGNYSLRIYDKDDNEIYNSTSSGNITIRNSRVYVIHGTNLSLIINGQSVIKGQLLELQSELDDATRPDMVKVVYNAPSIYSIFSKEGCKIGGTELVCPALFTIAKTINETTINSSTVFYPLIPESDSSNGTITVKTDTMYFTGDSTVSWVNVSYGSTTTNYSYIPNPLTLYGENVTVDTDGNLTIKRETEYQQARKFYWTKYTDTNYYTATVGIFNPFSNTTIREVYAIIEFANDTTPDYSTSKLYDVTNGVYLTRGENFDVTAGSYHFYLPSITADTTYQYTGSYYASTSSRVSNDAITIVDDYQMKNHINEDIASGENWYYIKGQWTNTDNDEFVGSITIQFNFDTHPQIISSRSFDVYDREKGVYLDRDDFTWNGQSLTISQDAVGTVQPNSARTFEVYFLFIEDDEDNDVVGEAEEWIKTEAFYGVQWFYIIEAVICLVAVGMASVAWDKRQKWKTAKREAWMSFIALFFAFILFIWYINMP